jgi:tetratricopeptide (TPR) repeat protein
VTEQGSAGAPGGWTAGQEPQQPPLYEREHAIRQAEQAVDAISRAYDAGGIELGSLLLYSGKGGVGKTSMLQQVRAIARRRGLTVLSGRAGEQRTKEPFHLLRQLLNGELAALPPAQQDEVFGSWREIAAPALGLKPPVPGEELDPASVRLGLEYVTTQLARLKAPLVLLVDDLQWADQESLAWVESLAVRCPELPVLLAIAWRPRDLPDGAEAFRTLVASNSQRHLEFHGLNPTSTGELVKAAFEDGVEDAFNRQVWAVTDGNPFLVGALLSKVRDAGIEPVYENVPMLHQLAAEAQGMDRGYWHAKLTVSTLNFAQAAAILGTQIRPEVATRMAGMTPAAAAAAIAELRVKKVLTGAADQALEFEHPLIATSLYQSIRDGIRTAMHGKAAVELENIGAPLVEFTRHLLEAHPEGDLEVVDKLRKAAKEHLAVGAPNAAVRCLDRALAEPPADEDQADVIYELACANLLTNPLATVNQLRRALGMPGLGADLRVDAAFRLSEVLAHIGSLVEAAEVTQTEAERTAPGVGRTRLEVAHFIWCLFQSEEADAAGRSDRLAAYSAAMPGEELAHRAARALRAWDQVVRGENAAAALELMDTALLPDGRLPEGLGWTSTTWGLEMPAIIGMTHIYADRLDRAEQLFDEAVTVFDASGWHGGHLGFAYFFMGLVRYRLGALVDAEEFLRSALRIARRLGEGLPLQWDTVGVLADVLLARGRFEEAWKLAQEYGFAPPFHPSALVLPDAGTLYGKLLLVQGDDRRAAEVLEQAGRRLDQRGWANSIWAPWAGLLARALVETDPERALELADLEVERAGRLGVDSAIGTALRMKAAVVEGQAAVDLLKQAVDHLGRSPAGYEHAYALVELGAALRRVGRLPEATEQLHQGMELAVECNADGLVSRAREELRASGLRPNRLRSTGKDTLSRAEWKVAVLAATGLVPSQIAAELDLPVNLVHRRLAAVHRKTGTTRESLAAALDRPGKRSDTP